MIVDYAGEDRVMNADRQLQQKKYRMKGTVVFLTEKWEHRTRKRTINNLGDELDQRRPLGPCENPFQRSSGARRELELELKSFQPLVE